MDLPSQFPIRLAAPLFLLLILSLVSGCGDSGPPRAAIWGKVTWKGEPVPSGVIYFSPDASRGNSGPQGFALIEDGVFDTRRPRAKGCSAGPQLVQIQGFDGQNKSDDLPYGNQLFKPYELAIDVPAEGAENDLTIPDSVKTISIQAN